MDRSDLMSKTVKELRTEAESLGIKRISALKKNELVDAILAASTDNNKAAAKAENKAPAKADKADAKKADAKKADKADAKKADKADAKKADKANAKKADKADAKKADKADAKKADKADAKKSTKADAKKADKADAKKAPAKKKAVKKADDADLDALEDEVIEDEELEELEDEVIEDEELEDEAEAVEEEPAPVEPDSVYIDRGAILPEYVPGTCLYALVRDPGTLFVYWNATFESYNGWVLTAYDAAGNELQSFTTPARRNGRGYFRIPTARVARVTLSIVHAGGNSEVKLESKIRIAEQLGIAQPRPAFDERWVNIASREVVYEAPAPGRAPAFGEVYQSMTGDGMTGGGFDRSVEAQAGQNGWCSIPGTSRFGALNAPGSSDTLVGSSDSIVRRRS